MGTNATLIQHQHQSKLTQQKQLNNSKTTIFINGCLNDKYLKYFAAKHLANHKLSYPWKSTNEFKYPKWAHSL